jgi:hypothetical protein
MIYCTALCFSAQFIYRPIFISHWNAKILTFCAEITKGSVLVPIRITINYAILQSCIQMHNAILRIWFTIHNVILRMWITKNNAILLVLITINNTNFAL